MKCEEIRGLMPDLASGIGEVNPDIRGHLAGCSACSGELEEMRRTMALLDEWQAPEPSAYFDARLQARLREEMAKPPAGWMAWFRRPVLATALTVLMAIGIGLVFRGGEGIYRSGDSVVADNDSSYQAAPGTAVGDLSALDKNNDLYSDFELLDDLQVQAPNGIANP
jgi:predicted anti-sigma-YlaC factor YlaD